ncbi:putative Late nodulin [Lupinus albus]|uniref:Putative Late nodulin n=1 Tax=Lupinus albus TaxID=3870 RepID=A0A6A4NUP6_LUPAL|nr:putative Late nodulin [Lupinus albus]
MSTFLKFVCIMVLFFSLINLVMSGSIPCIDDEDCQEWLIGAKCIGGWCREHLEPLKPEMNIEV